MPGTTRSPQPTRESCVKRTQPRTRKAVDAAGKPPAAAMSGIHPVPAVSGALAACLRAGLRVYAARQGALWGGVSCSTGAHRMAVRVNPAADARHRAPEALMETNHGYRESFRANMARSEASTTGDTPSGPYR